MYYKTMWTFIHFVFIWFCKPSPIMHSIASTIFFLLSYIGTKKISLSDVVPCIALLSMYVGVTMAEGIYHWGYLPWWVTTICGFRKQKTYIWAGGVILGLIFYFLSWRQRIGHCIMNIGRMLKIKKVSFQSLSITHFTLACIYFLMYIYTENLKVKWYIDILAGLSAVSCVFWQDNMSWFSIGMLFTNPLSSGLCVIHILSPYWYNYYKNNHYRKVKYSFYFVYPILILVGLLFREEITMVRQTYNV